MLDPSRAATGPSDTGRAPLGDRRTRGGRRSLVGSRPVGDPLDEESGLVLPAEVGGLPTVEPGEEVAADEVRVLRAADPGEQQDDGRQGWALDRRASLLGVVAVGVLLVLAVLVTRPSVDAIVVGDGLTLPSGPGPAVVPSMRWDTEIALVDTLPPVIAAETVVVGGRSGRGAALIGVDRSSGRRLWAAPVANGPPLSVAAVDGDVVVVADTGSGFTTVTRLAARTGDDVWERPTTALGSPARVVALPGGGSLVEVVDRSGGGRAVVVDGSGDVVLDEPGTTVAASATLVARRDGRTVHLHALDGAPRGSVDVGSTPDGTDHLALAGGLVVVGEGDVVRAFDVASGGERWSVRPEADVAALAATSRGVAVITRAEHLGTDLAGEVLWRDRGFPLPLVRDGDDVTLLVAPGTTAALELRVVDARGEPREEATVDRGAYLALGRAFAFVAVGDDVVAVPLDDASGTWSVETEGEVRWLVLDGPTMLAASVDRGGTILSSWG